MDLTQLIRDGSAQVATLLTEVFIKLTTVVGAFALAFLSDLFSLTLRTLFGAGFGFILGHTPIGTWICLGLYMSGMMMMPSYLFTMGAALGFASWFLVKEHIKVT